MKEFVLQDGAAPKLNIDYAAELNEEQLAVVQHGDGPTLVLAGAGSGKTRTITYRVAWLLEHGVPPDRIMLLTFTNKAAKEMIVRIEALLKSYPHGVWAGTFHSVANRLLRKYGAYTGYGHNFSILDEEDANDLMKLCIKELKIDTKGKRFPSPGVLRGLRSYCVNARKTVADVLAERHEHFLPIQGEIEMVINRFAQAKLEQQTMDFDDLLVVMLELLQNSSQLREALSMQFEYVLVDEFQDTNIIQAEIVDLLSSTHRNVLVVGDDAQSIYSFRAAQIKNILDFPKRYANANVFRLVTNYRSTPEILDVANAVIANNADQFKKDLVAVVHSGEKPFLIPAADALQEAQYVVEQILQLGESGVRLSNMAVLFRAAFHSQALEFELMKRGIPYEYRGGMKFFERAHIKDAIAHMRILRNVKDAMAWIRALQIYPGIGLATAQKIADGVSQCETTVDALMMTPKLSPKTLSAWQNVVRVLKGMQIAISPAESVRAFAASEEYRSYLEAEYPNYRDRLDDIEQFAVFAEQYREIGPFLDAVTLTGDFGARLDDLSAKAQEEDGDRLILSTIHQAKGLEWDAVFVIHVAEGMFPHSRSLGEAGGLEEERRLFYVAATRARRRLFLSYPITTGYETIELRQPSPFLDEIPRHMLEEVRLRVQRSPWTSSSYHARKNGGSSWDHDEPTIVLDDMGEKVIKKEAPGSFLRDLDDL